MANLLKFRRERGREESERRKVGGREEREGKGRGGGGGIRERGRSEGKRKGKNNRKETERLDRVTHLPSIPPDFFKLLEH